MGYTLTVIAEETPPDEATAKASEQAALDKAKALVKGMEGVTSGEFLGDFLGYHDIGAA